MFKIKELKYSFSDLNPFISEEGFKLHYLRHHQTYTDNFNKAYIDEEVKEKACREIFPNIEKYSTFLKNNIGGYWNHNFFWDSLSPEKTEIGFETKLLIEKKFKTFEKFKKEFDRVSLTLFGSGWAWLVVDKDSKEIEVISTSNQENPLMSSVEGNYEVLLTLDVWEHSYYPTFENKRADYIKEFWNFINWDKVEERLKKVI